jgi:hypothetical protein
MRQFYQCALRPTSMIGRCGGPNRRFEFEKRCQLFIRTHNETLSVPTMCVQQSRSFFTQTRMLPFLFSTPQRENDMNSGHETNPPDIFSLAPRFLRTC